MRSLIWIVAGVQIDDELDLAPGRSDQVEVGPGLRLDAVDVVEPVELVLEAGIVTEAGGIGFPFASERQ